MPADGLAHGLILPETWFCHRRRRRGVEQLGVGFQEIIDYNTMSSAKMQLFPRRSAPCDIVEDTGPGRVLHIGAVAFRQRHRRLTATPLRG